MDLSVVIPIYNSAQCLEELYRRLSSVLGGLGIDYEIIFVEDRGKDNSWEILKELAKNDHRVVALRHSKNSGQHPATVSGLGRSKGDWILVMDGDLEHPPEEIPLFLAKSRAGVEAIHGIRANAPVHPWWRLLLSSIHFGLLRLLTGIENVGEYGEFLLMSRRAKELILDSPWRGLGTNLSLVTLGVPRDSVRYRQDRRPAGESSYTIWKLLRHAFRGYLFSIGMRAKETMIRLASFGVAAVSAVALLFGSLLLFLFGFIVVVCLTLVVHLTTWIMRGRWEQRLAELTKVEEVCCLAGGESAS